MTLYKVTAPDGAAIHGGKGRWHPERWREVKGTLVPCRNGLHLTYGEHLVTWLGPAIWRAEAEGELILTTDGIVARKARTTERIEAWDERAARSFAADCAEHVLWRLDVEDTRAAEAIRGALARAAGSEVDRWALAKGAGQLAHALEGNPAGRSAALAAAWSVLESPAALAARGVARLAVEAAAWSGARSEERRWQTERLFAYLGVDE